jgi:hypothetical protein
MIASQFLLAVTVSSKECFQEFDSRLDSFFNSTKPRPTRYQAIIMIFMNRELIHLNWDTQCFKMNDHSKSNIFNIRLDVDTNELSIFGVFCTFLNMSSVFRSNTKRFF